MSDVFFTSNPAEYTKLEGLYITERQPPGFIRGRDLSMTGLAGRCVKGPLTPQVITSPARFAEVYGERDWGAGGAIIGNVWRALLNKPFGTVVVRRVAAAAAVPASFTLETAAGGAGSAVVRIDASSPGVWGNDIQVKVEAASDGDATHWNLRVRWLGREQKFENLNTTSADNLLQVLGDDIGNLVVATKILAGRPANNAPTVDGGDAEGFVNLGETVTAFTSILGTEGTLNNTDYITGVTELANYEDLAVVLVPEAAPVHSTFQATLVTLAAAASDRIFLTWAGIHGQTVSAEIIAANAALTSRSDRLVWVYNSPKTIDPKDGTKVDTAPHVWLASILSQNDVDVHPGAQQCGKQLAGITNLANEGLTRGDLVLLRAAGICALEKLHGQFLPRSGVTTNLTSGLTEIVRRRCADFLQLSAASRLRFYVKQKSTLEIRAQMAGELVAFSRGLKDQGRIIEDFVVEQETVNTAATRAQGIEKLLWRVKLLGHMLFIVMETEIGTGVIIEAQAA